MILSVLKVLITKYEFNFRLDIDFLLLAVNFASRTLLIIFQYFWLSLVSNFQKCAFVKKYFAKVQKIVAFLNKTQ